MRQAYEVGFSIPVDSKNKGGVAAGEAPAHLCNAVSGNWGEDKKFKLHFLTGFLIRQRSPLPGCPFLF
jgi:hypothetical protein